MKNLSCRPTIHTSNSRIISKDSLAHWRFFSMPLPTLYPCSPPSVDNLCALWLRSLQSCSPSAVHPWRHWWPFTAIMFPSITCGAFSYLYLSHLPFLCYDPKAKAWHTGCPPLYNKWDWLPFFLSSKGQKSTQDSNICFFSRSKQQVPVPSRPPR